MIWVGLFERRKAVGWVWCGEGEAGGNRQQGGRADLLQWGGCMAGLAARAFLLAVLMFQNLGISHVSCLSQT